MDPGDERSAGCEALGGELSRPASQAMALNDARMPMNDARGCDARILGFGPAGKQPIMEATTQLVSKFVRMAGVYHE